MRLLPAPPPDETRSASPPRVEPQARDAKPLTVAEAAAGMPGHLHQSASIDRSLPEERRRTAEQAVLNAAAAAEARAAIRRHSTGAVGQGGSAAALNPFLAALARNGNGG